MKKRLILASQSPRRKELLSWLDISFEVIPSDVDENSSEKDPQRLVEELSLRKAMDIWSKVNDSSAFIIASDTLVFLGERIFGKPNNILEAREMLESLSGKEHTVRTAVSFIYESRESKICQVTFSDKTLVEFAAISPYLLERYLECGESLDKAGAYGIQGKSLSFIKSIKGSYSNVVGFPLSLVVERMKECLGENWFDYF